MSISKKLARFISNIKWADLTPRAREMARLSFLDWLGSVAAGGREEPALIALETVGELGGNPESTLLPTGEKSSCLNAALVNGIASHIVELDDVHRGAIIHAGAAVIPAALAIGEKLGVSGKQFLVSVVTGYEVAIRVGEAVTPSHYYYWHTTGTCGAFGAAAAAGKLLGLNQEQLIWCLGNAGTQAAGLWEFLADGAMSKHLHPGKAAQNGLLAALMARRNFTGASLILEGERGFCKATAPSFDLDKITQGLAEGPYKIEENCFKVHSSCRHTHPAIDAIFELKQKYGINRKNVEKAIVHTYSTALDITANYNPGSVYASKFSLPFCVALALNNHRCGTAEFNPESLNDQETRDFMRKVELHVDEEIEAQHPALWSARVEIVTRDGHIYEGFTRAPKGDPDNPLSSQELVDKFLNLARSPWGGRADKILNRVEQLERADNIANMF